MKNGVKVISTFLILYFLICQFGCSKDKKTETIVVTDTERQTSLETSSAPKIPKITEKEMGEYTYPIFCDEGSPVYIHLPVVLEEYIEETKDGNYKYLLGKLITDYGWQEKDFDENGLFSIPVGDLSYFSYEEVIHEGDYFYYDCGDMWIRLRIQDRLMYFDSNEVTPEWIDYSFILPDSPEEPYYNHVIYTPYPTNNAIAQIFTLFETRYATDIDDLYVSYDYFVILAFVITWPSIDPYENPFYYIPFNEIGSSEELEKEILRDKYDIY